MPEAFSQNVYISVENGLGSDATCANSSNGYFYAILYSCNYYDGSQNVPTTATCHIDGPNGLSLDYGGGASYPQGTTFSFTGLVPGLYTVTCTSTIGGNQSVITRNIGHLVEVPNVTTSATSVICGTPATITLSTSIYYLQDIAITGPNGYTFNGVINNNNDLLVDVPTGGSYTVTATNDCPPAFTAVVTVNSTGDVPTFSATAYVSDCNAGGSITIVNTGTTSETITVSGTSFNQTITPGQVLDTPIMQSGNYTFTATNSSCPNNPATVSVNVTLGNPELVITETHENTSSGFNNGSIILSVANGNPPYTCLWNTGSTDLDIVNIVAGTYTATVTDSKGCTKTITITVTNSTGINDIANAIGNLSFAPNPVTGREVVMNLDATTNQTISIAVFNNMGQEISRQANVLVTQGQNKIRVSLQSGLASGIYSLRIMNDQGKGGLAPFMYIAE